MTDEIRGQLSQVSSLRLLSRNALDAYKDGDQSRMVRELGVRNFVDGSVRVDGNRVRISAELVDASKNETLWSDQYHRELSDILAVQGDVAVQITRALHANLSPHEQQRLGYGPPATSRPTGCTCSRSRWTPRGSRAESRGDGGPPQGAHPGSTFAVAQARLGYRLVFMGFFDDPSYVDKGMAEAQAALRVDPLCRTGISRSARPTP